MQNQPTSSRTRRLEPLLRWGSTALAAIVIALAALSYAVCIRLSQRSVPQPDGTLVWEQVALHAGGTRRSTSFPFPPPQPAPLPVVEWVGFGNAPSSGPATVARVSMTSGTPLIVLTPAAIALVLWAAHARRIQLARRHACASCLYDLRGLPERVPCPECGAARA